MAIEDLDSKQELWRWILETAEAEGLPMSVIEGLQVAVTPGKWEPLVLENGFSNHEGESPAAWRTLPGGAVSLRGLVVNSGAVAEATVIAKLPAAISPATPKVFGGVGNFSISSPARIDVREDAVKFMEAATTVAYCSLDQILFWPGS